MAKTKTTRAKTQQWQEITTIAPNYVSTRMEPVGPTPALTPAEIRAKKIKPRNKFIHYFRYTVDELLSLMVVCGDGDQVLLYDTCNMGEYRYHKTSLEKDNFKPHVGKETHLRTLFELFALGSDVFGDYEDRYWESLAPGAQLLSSVAFEPDDGIKTDDCYEYPQTKLDIASDSCVFMMEHVPLVHTLPLNAVHNWLKFVGRKFSDISQDMQNQHAPFCTLVD